ncbi:hypothetical protein [Catelliglobosispora koreensis]|uniref:hypothetical protein n=1 Tax=Catelliglobosispora koreensis TaxID=129052 RepID=UPI00036A9D95|nr:hypothetical protein [Catelliglobosispora koreensis]
MRENNPWAPPAWMGEASSTPVSEAAPETVTEPFTLPAQEVPRELWTIREPKPPVATVRKIKRPLRMSIALPLVIVLGLFSAFFSWVTAEPLWLAVGHGSTSTAVVTKCVGNGLTQRCQGEVDGLRVTLLGLESPHVGERVEVQRVNDTSHRAYSGGVFMRWFTGLLMVLLCGCGIALALGVQRQPASRERWAAAGTAFAGPLLVTVGFLAATF